jgi:hypothetical protein
MIGDGGGGKMFNEDMDYSFWGYGVLAQFENLGHINRRHKIEAPACIPFASGLSGSGSLRLIKIDEARSRSSIS